MANRIADLLAYHYRVELLPHTDARVLNNTPAPALSGAYAGARPRYARRVPCRLVFRCEFCRAEPDQLTQVSLERQLLHYRFGQYVDCGPAGWLVWHGRGPYGRVLYAGQDHRERLRAHVIRCYDGPHARSKTIHPSLPPDDLEFARRRAQDQGWTAPRALRGS